MCLLMTMKHYLISSLWRFSSLDVLWFIDKRKTAYVVLLYFFIHFIQTPIEMSVEERCRVSHLATSMIALTQVLSVLFFFSINNYFIYISSSHTKLCMLCTFRYILNPVVWSFSFVSRAYHFSMPAMKFCAQSLLTVTLIILEIGLTGSIFSTIGRLLCKVTMVHVPY